MEISATEINRKISSVRHKTRCGCEYWADSADNQNWTGSEDASAVLLEEIPNPAISRGTLRMWSCLPDILDLRNELQHADRKIAIALAWLKWKGRLK